MLSDLSDLLQFYTILSCQKVSALVGHVIDKCIVAKKIIMDKTLELNLFIVKQSLHDVEFLVQRINVLSPSGWGQRVGGCEFILCPVCLE